MKRPCNTVYRHSNGIVELRIRTIAFIFNLGDLYTESGQTSQCSISSVSTPPTARVGAFFNIFRDLQDFRSFAPLRTKKISKTCRIFFLDYHIFAAMLFRKILPNLVQILLNLNKISPEFHQNFTLWTPPSPRIQPTYGQQLSQPRAAIRRKFSHQNVRAERPLSAIFHASSSLALQLLTVA